MKKRGFYPPFGKGDKYPPFPPWQKPCIKFLVKYSNDIIAHFWLESCLHWSIFTFPKILWPQKYLPCVSLAYWLIQKIAVKLVSNREPTITLFQPNHVNFLGRGLLLGTQALMVILNSDGPIATGHSRTINSAPNWNFGNLPHKTLFHIFMASVTNPCDRTTRIPPPPPSSSENSKA